MNQNENDTSGWKVVHRLADRANAQKYLKKQRQQKKLDMTVKLFSGGQTETKINGLWIYLLLGLLTLRQSVKTLDNIQNESAA